MYSNSGFEGEKGARARSEILDKLEKDHEVAIQKIYEEYEEEEIDMSNPFFAHAYDGLPPLEIDEKE